MKGKKGGENLKKGDMLREREREKKAVAWKCAGK